VNLWKTIVGKYLTTVTPPGLNTIRPQLWNRPENAFSDHDVHEVLEQYKIYVEMADRISTRRGVTNTFFLTLNTGFATILVPMWRDGSTSIWHVLLSVVVLEGQCLAWFWLLRSYRQLNSAKYAVIGALEERLPASPYWRAEWEALGQGKDPGRYLPLTRLEQWVPALFTLAYLGAFVIALTD
jgi:hypothetical protein